jgi:hypothetical protein
MMESAPSSVLSITAKSTAEHSTLVAITLLPLPPPSIHWSAYITAIATPAIAIVAAAIAGLIAYRNWRTAQNKLKLDLFEKRHKLFQDLNRIRGKIAIGSFGGDDDTYTDFLALRTQMRWMFDKKINSYMNNFHDHVRMYYVLHGLFENDLETQPTTNEAEAKKQEIKEWMSKQRIEMLNVFSSALTLSHQ